MIDANKPQEIPKTQRRSPSQTRGKRRIETILDAAAILFDKIGFEAATTILIAQRAKTAVGSLYDFFPNKEAIAEQLTERFIADLQALLDSLITPEIAFVPLEPVLGGLVDLIVGFIHTRPGFRALHLQTKIGEYSTAQRNLDQLMTERLANILSLRYPNANPAVVLRTVRVNIETLKALTGLAIQTDPPDANILNDLKLMLRVCIEANLEPSTS
jgi:AcrR family transcriptional regulator